MNDLTTQQNRIRPMSIEAIGKARQIEFVNRDLPQVQIETMHTLHAGVYARTITMPEGTVLTGALIKRSTTLIISGHAVMTIGDDAAELNGYGVVAASANRKQVFYAIKETHLTMLFATTAKTVEQAENEFTDEGDLLCSRLPGAINHITITGE